MKAFPVTIRTLLWGGALLFAACVYGPAVITDEMTPAELIQRAQEASDHNAYGVALEYYQALLNRYSSNPELLCTGEYEIAFIHYKQKKYADARTEFNALLERYRSPGAELLPPQFRRLSTIVLERITEKEKTKAPFSGFMSLFKKKPSADEPQS